MINQNVATSLSIVTIFFITFLIIVIKNVFFNSKSYSRKLRICISFIGFSYLVGVIIFIIALMLSQNPSIEIIILGVLMHISMSMCGIWIMIHFEEKKASVRDVWKYRSKHFKNFKLSNAPKRNFEKCLNIIKVIFLLFYAAMSIALLVYSARGSQWIFMAAAIISLLDLSFNYCYMGRKTIELINKNARYNELKTIILIEGNDENKISEKTFKECVKKALKLYDILFTNTMFYRKAIDTNNAIVIEMAEKGKLSFEETQRYLTDPISKNTNPTIGNIKDRYDVPANW